MFSRFGGGVGPSWHSTWKNRTTRNAISFFHAFEAVASNGKTQTDKRLSLHPCWKDCLFGPWPLYAMHPLFSNSYGHSKSYISQDSMLSQRRPECIPINFVKCFGKMQADDPKRCTCGQRFFASKRGQAKGALQFAFPAENHVVLPVALLQVNPFSKSHWINNCRRALRLSIPQPPKVFTASPARASPMIASNPLPTLGIAPDW